MVDGWIADTSRSEMAMAKFRRVRRRDMRQNDGCGSSWLESVLLLLDDGGSGGCRWD
ncbi:hypothetical protein CASFOL_034154 [Castilleja foliolosa]|uniref:Uncharacterized protein n=1 Tax=Castilleja foliolosa TaxID=1961234 RepID=A0ABD3BWP6_9LAMI